MGKKLYVGGLSWGTDDRALEAAFEKFGTVDSATVIVDRDTGRSKGFGFVEMSTDEEAKKAIAEMDGSVFDGRNIKCNEAKPREPRQNDRY
jgi:cold-inducible RNA-binding protein